ncbi:MAG: hypothetical protein AABY83_03280 [Pseudomonadota bacterium]
MRHIGCVSSLIFVAGCHQAPPLRVESAPAFHLYVSLPAADDIARIDPVVGKILSKTTVGSLPHNFLLHPDGRRLYVVLVGSQAIAEVDATTGVLRRTLLTERVPMARDDGTVIQPHLDRKADTHASCYDCHNSDPTGARPVVVGSRPFAIAFNEAASALYVTNMRTRTLTTVDLASGALLDRTVLPASGDAFEPTGVALLKGDLYVAMRPNIPSSRPGVVRRLDAATRATTAEAANGPNTSVVLADPANARLYVNNFETSTVTAFGIAGDVLASYAVRPGPLGLRLLEQGHRLVVANYYDDSLSMVDLASGDTRTWSLRVGETTYVNPTHTAVDPAGDTLYVVSSGTRGNLLAFDLTSSTFTHALPLGGLPFDVVSVPSPVATE